MLGVSTPAQPLSLCPIYSSSPLISAGPHHRTSGAASSTGWQGLYRHQGKSQRRNTDSCMAPVLGLTSLWQNASRCCLCCPQPSSKGCLHCTDDSPLSAALPVPPLTPACSSLSAFTSTDSATEHKPVAC